MLDQYFSRRSVLERLRTGLFGPYLNQLAGGLVEQGYSHDWIHTCLYASDKDRPDGQGTGADEAEPRQRHDDAIQGG